MSDKTPQEIFDSDGYPTDQTLDAIEYWPHTDWLGLMQFVREAWSDCGWIDQYESKYFHEDGPDAHTWTWCAATGGWSGNESLVAALDHNTMFSSMCWYASTRGGYHEWRIPKEAKP
jgi:hypothetical protein